MICGVNELIPFDLDFQAECLITLLTTASAKYDKLGIQIKQFLVTDLNEFSIRRCK